MALSALVRVPCCQGTKNDHLILCFKYHMEKGALKGVMGSRGKNLVSFLEMVIEVFIAILKALTPPVTNQVGSVLSGQ